MATGRGRQKRRPLFLFLSKEVFLSILVVALCFTAGKLMAGSGDRPARGPEVGPPKPEGGPLSGQIIYIDPGHGGIDPGKCGNKYLEKNIVLDIALYLGVRLEKSGAKVVYSRTGDYDLESQEVDDVTARQRLIESSGATIMISLHCNSFTDPQERGAQVFYNAKKHPDSKRLATIVQEKLQQETGTERVASSWLEHFMLNYGNIPAITIETGFLSNPEEENLLGTPSYQQDMADWIRDAVITFVESPE